MLNLDRKKNIHFIGIGGSGMSGLAKSLHDMGYFVTGSDMNDSETIKELRKFGVTIYIGHNTGNLPTNTAIVVKSAAVNEENPEIMAAKFRNLKILKYSEMLGFIMGLKKGIAISGTHGKTTITAMLSYILKKAHLDPTYVIGGVSMQLDNKSSNVGKGEYFITEACEYDKSFHNLNMELALINNIEEDHLDFYKDINDIIDSFEIFAKKIPENGTLFYSASSTNIQKFVDNLSCNKVSYAIESKADFVAKSITFEGNGSCFVVETPTTSFDVELSIPGYHNVINSLGAISISLFLGIDVEVIKKSLKEFIGVKRRFEIIYDNNITIIDDYAHHPTEIQTVLQSCKKCFDKERRIVAVFQPHQHSRTRFLLKDFAKSFENADLIIVPDIYFVRDSENEKEMVHAKNLVEKIIKNGKSAIYIPSFDEIKYFLQNNLLSDDVLITLGAGNINIISHYLKDFYEEKERNIE